MNEIKNNYMNRELSWMDFNYRVLEEAFEIENPILERLRFLAITASNLDEFFMVRVAGVRQQVDFGYTKRDESGYSPKELLGALYERIRHFTDQQYRCLYDSILPELRAKGISFVTPDEMNSKQKRFVSDYFSSVVFPVLTPIAVNEDRQFPKLLGRSLNIAVRLKKKGKEKEKEGDVFAVVQVPSNIPRCLELPSGKGRVFALLEEIISYKMESLFELYQVKACCPFRITRNSDVEIDDEAPDLIAEVQKFIKKRKQGKPVRLEIPKKCDVEIREFLTRRLKIKKEEVFKCRGPLDLTLFSKFANLDRCEELRFDPVVPVNPPADFWGYDDIFEAIREGDRMVHHPYESFDAVVELVRAAADDPNVLAIKQTLYRVSGHSPIIEALIHAAENGKQVTVLVELKARFDEENNVEWAKLLEKAGCHVIYGIRGLKTHCKILSVVRHEGDRLRNYLHVATGNYNDSTARLYTDIGMFTCSDTFSGDAIRLFNMLTGYESSGRYSRFVVAPKEMRGFFEDMINREIANAQSGKRCGITAKINSLVDPPIIKLLYRASQEGVPVRLIVRGICCLVPGRKGLSETITVRSIVGQLLEHSRIFRFENGGRPKFYLGSADWMQRNLNRRVELVFPVEDKRLKARVNSILDILMQDNYNAREMQSDGSYQLVKPEEGEPAVNSQRRFMELAAEAQAEAKRRFEQRQTKEKDRANEIPKTEKESEGE